jgi:hypothetical protein
MTELIVQAHREGREISTKFDEDYELITKGNICPTLLPLNDEFGNLAECEQFISGIPQYVKNIKG